MIDYKKIIDKLKREMDQKEETNRKLQLTIHDLTISYEGQKKENANLKSIKWNLETDKIDLEKKIVELRRQVIQQDGKIAFKQSLSQLGKSFKNNEYRSLWK